MIGDLVMYIYIYILLKIIAPERNEKKILK